MLGTFAGALDARKINAKESRLTADVRGEVETENKVLVIRRVHVTFRLRTAIPNEVRDTVDRVHRVRGKLSRVPLAEAGISDHFHSGARARAGGSNVIAEFALYPSSWLLVWPVA